jgi:hypothetical protein
MYVAINVAGPRSSGTTSTQTANSGNADMNQIMALQKQLSSLEKQLKLVKGDSGGAPSLAQAQLISDLTQQINAVQQEIQKIQQANMAKNAAQQAKTVDPANAPKKQAPTPAYKSMFGHPAPFSFNGVPGVIVATTTDDTGQTVAAPTDTLGSVIDTQA